LINSSPSLGKFDLLTTIPESSYRTSDSLFWKIVWALQTIVSLFKFAKGKSGSKPVMKSLIGTNALMFHNNKQGKFPLVFESQSLTGPQQSFS